MSYNHTHNHKHSHGHTHTHGHTFGPSHNKNYNKKQMQNTIIIAMIIVFAFTIIEFVGGYISGSLALIADAGHALTDFISLLFAFIGLQVSKRINNQKKTYGYSRFEIIMSLLNAVFLVMVCIYIVYEAILRFLNPVVVDPVLMLPVAVMGLLANFLVMYIFSRAERKNRSKEEEKQGRSLLMESAVLHFIADALGSVVAIIVSITIYYTNWYIVDPILSVVLVVLISNGTFRVIYRSINILMESAPQEIQSQYIETYIEENIEEVLDIHHIHLWMLNEEENIITLHAVVAKGENFHDVTDKIKHILKEHFGIEHSTIQIEEKDRACLDKDII